MCCALSDQKSIISTNIGFLVLAFSGNDGRAIGLKVSWMTVFQVFMFSLSLSTGLQPDLAPLSPYTLVVANLNALIAQLILAFLSAAGTWHSMDAEP